ncbi:MAG: PilZ domain-containing protein [Candidatus Omnitrophota bacterium]
MENITEKRKFLRVATHIPVKYRKLGDSEVALRGCTITRNLSEGGVRFRTPDFISRACRLILELDMPMLTKPIKAISKVAWIRKTTSGEDFEIGNQFLEMSKKDKELVSEYVNSLTHYNDVDSVEDFSSKYDNSELPAEG